MPRHIKPIQHKTIKQNIQEIIPQNTPDVIPALTPEKKSVFREKWGYLLLLWIGFCLVLAAFPNHSWMFPAFISKIMPQSSLLLLGLFIGMVVVIKRFSSEPIEAADFSPKATRIFLLIILVIAAFSRFHFSEKPIGPAWGDQFLELTTARYIFDTKDYRNAFVVGVEGGVLPPFSLWPYIFFLSIFPSIKALMLERIIFILIYTLDILFIYLAGKEAVNRRVGIFAAAVAVVSKPLIQESLGCALLVSGGTLSISLTLWFFFRALRKPPSLGNFIVFGTAIGIISYCYTPFRIMIPFYVFAALAWILHEQKAERRMGIRVGALVWSTVFLFFMFIYYVHVLFVKDTWITRVMDISGPWLPCMALAVFLIIGLYSAPRVMTEGRFPYLTGWVAATWVCIVISFPMLTHPTVQNQIKAYIAPKTGFCFQFIETLNFLFNQPLLRGFRNDMAISGDCFFGFSEIVLGTLGLAWVFAKPKKTGVFLVAAFFAGWCPYMLTYSPHSFRMMLCASPLFLIAGFALEKIWGKCTERFPGQRIRVLFVVLFACFWVWSGWATYHRVIVQWARGMIGKNMAVYHHAEQDQKLGYRVYFSNAFLRETNPVALRATFALYEGCPVYCFLPTNTIYLKPNETTQNVAIYLSTTYDSKLKKDISDVFPNVNWETIKGMYTYLDTTMGEVVWRCEIPAAEIKNQSTGLLKFQQAFSPCWKRSFFNVEAGLRLACLDAEDCVTDPSSPIPAGFDIKNRAVQFNCRIQVEQEGKFEISCKTPQLIRIRLDEKNILNINFPITNHYGHTTTEKSGKRKVFLSVGEHSVEVLTYLQNPIYLPQIQLGRKGQPPQSLWTSFQY